MLGSSLQRTTHRICVAAFVVLTAGSTFAARSYKVLFNFNRTSAEPSSGLVVDSHGNAYGTTFSGGHNGAGSVYELLSATGYHLLYPFALSGPGGQNPQGNLIFDSKGNLYGTTVFGGASSNFCAAPYLTCGVVFELTPPANGTGLWTETVLYTFCSLANCTDGANPQSGVIIDSEGNLYGTTNFGGNNSCGVTSCGDGVVFKLSPPADGVGTWTETVLHTFCLQGGFCLDGALPYGGLIFDTAGNLFGTTNAGGSESDSGEVFELSPSANGWTESVLYSFCLSDPCTDGRFPFGSLTFDGSGNLYGTTSEGGNMSLCSGAGCGTVFELTPKGGSWTETTLHAFNGGDGAISYAGVVLDSVGNIYGTTRNGGGESGDTCRGEGCGTVFRLTRQANGSWNESLFRFPDNEELGLQPMSPVTLGSDDNIYGTTTGGGVGFGVGVVFKITQPNTEVLGLDDSNR